MSKKGIEEQEQFKTIITNNFTIESLVELFQYYNRGIICHIDELGGLIQGFNQYKKKGNDIEEMLKLWNGGAIVTHRVGKVKYCDKSGLAIIGGIQPQSLVSIFKQSIIDNGLMPRFLFCLMKQTPRIYNLNNNYNAYLWHETINTIYRHTYYNNNTQIIEFSIEAKELYKKYIDNENLTLNNDKLDIFIAKLHEYILRVAGVLYMTDLLTEKTTKNEITVAHLKKAIKVIKFFRSQASLALTLYDSSLSELTVQEKAVLNVVNKMQANTSIYSKEILIEANKELPDALKFHNAGKGCGVVRKILLKFGFTKQPRTSHGFPYFLSNSVIESLQDRLSIIETEQKEISFPDNIFSPDLEHELKTIAEDFDISYGAVASSALTVLSSAIGNYSRYKMKETHIVPSFLWTCLVGSSGSCKSAPVTFLLSTIYQIQSAIYATQTP